jgi:hypothetical protein
MFLNFSNIGFSEALLVSESDKFFSGTHGGFGYSFIAGLHGSQDMRRLVDRTVQCMQSLTIHTISFRRFLINLIDIVRKEQILIFLFLLIV